MKKEPKKSSAAHIFPENNGPRAASRSGGQGQTDYTLPFYRPESFNLTRLHQLTEMHFSLHRPPAHCFLNGKICEARDGLHMLKFKVEIGDSENVILPTQAQPAPHINSASLESVQSFSSAVQTFFAE